MYKFDLYTLNKDNSYVIGTLQYNKSINYNDKIQLFKALVQDKLISMVIVYSVINEVDYYIETI